ncbi:Uncharacterized protein FWK35_00026524 [Aphis craccivora]|uniref:Uncharacterized protein n=1 Tax=Aphis craccivora TaxID=307492 RepID=A0A6G0YY02_APHCR|nr:Uncharacterized protein FWK35_00026524 [Aphis craccivora]
MTSKEKISWRRVKSNSLETYEYYREDETFSKFCAMLDGLAFLSINDIEKGLLYLKDIMSDKAKEHGRKQRTISALYSRAIGMECYGTTLRDGNRTNNQCEGWNHRFSNLVTHNHLSIWTLFKKMRLEIVADETKIAQRELGTLDPPRKKPKYVKMQEKLMLLCLEYINGEKELDIFLIAIANIIRSFI